MYDIILQHMSQCLDFWWALTQSRVHVREWKYFKICLTYHWNVQLSSFWYHHHSPASHHLTSMKKVFKLILESKIQSIFSVLNLMWIDKEGPPQWEPHFASKQRLIMRDWLCFRDFAFSCDSGLLKWCKSVQCSATKSFYYNT